MASLRRSQSRLEDGGDAVAQALISDIDARAGHAAALLEVLDRSSWRTKARTESSKQVHDSPVAAVPPIVTKQPHAGDGGHAQAVDSGETARARAAVVPPLNLPIIGSAETPRAIDNPKLGEDASDSRPTEEVALQAGDLQARGINVLSELKLLRERLDQVAEGNLDTPNAQGDITVLVESQERRVVALEQLHDELQDALRAVVEQANLPWSELHLVDTERGDSGSNNDGDARQGESDAASTDPDDWPDPETARARTAGGGGDGGDGMEALREELYRLQVETPEEEQLRQLGADQMELRRKIARLNSEEEAIVSDAARPMDVKQEEYRSLQEEIAEVGRRLKRIEAALRDGVIKLAPDTREARLRRQRVEMQRVPRHHAVWVLLGIMFRTEGDQVRQMLPSPLQDGNPDTTAAWVLRNNAPYPALAQLQRACLCWVLEQAAECYKHADGVLGLQGTQCHSLSLSRVSQAREELAETTQRRGPLPRSLLDTCLGACFALLVHVCHARRTGRGHLPFAAWWSAEGEEEAAARARSPSPQRSGAAQRTRPKDGGGESPQGEGGRSEEDRTAASPWKSVCMTWTPHLVESLQHSLSEELHLAHAAAAGLSSVVAGMESLTAAAAAVVFAVTLGVHEVARHAAWNSVVLTVRACREPGGGYPRQLEEDFSEALAEYQLPQSTTLLALRRLPLVRVEALCRRSKARVAAELAQKCVAEVSTVSGPMIAQQLEVLLAVQALELSGSEPTDRVKQLITELSQQRWTGAALPAQVSRILAAELARNSKDTEAISQTRRAATSVCDFEAAVAMELGRAEASFVVVKSELLRALGHTMDLVRSQSSVMDGAVARALLSAMERVNKEDMLPPQLVEQLREYLPTSTFSRYNEAAADLRHQSAENSMLRATGVHPLEHSVAQLGVWTALPPEHVKLLHVDVLSKPMTNVPGPVAACLRERVKRSTLEFERMLEGDTETDLLADSAHPPQEPPLGSGEARRRGGQGPRQSRAHSTDGDAATEGSEVEELTGEDSDDEDRLLARASLIARAMRGAAAEAASMAARAMQSVRLQEDLRARLARTAEAEETEVTSIVDNFPNDPMLCKRGRSIRYYDQVLRYRLAAATRDMDLVRAEQEKLDRGIEMLRSRREQQCERLRKADLLARFGGAGQAPAPSMSEGTVKKTVSMFATARGSTERQRLVRRLRIVANAMQKLERNMHALMGAQAAHEERHAAEVATLADLRGQNDQLKRSVKLERKAALESNAKQLAGAKEELSRLRREALERVSGYQRLMRQIHTLMRRRRKLERKQSPELRALLQRMRTQPLSSFNDQERKDPRTRENIRRLKRRIARLHADLKDYRKLWEAGKKGAPVRAILSGVAKRRRRAEQEERYEDMASDHATGATSGSSGQHEDGPASNGSRTLTAVGTGPAALKEDASHVDGVKTERSSSAASGTVARAGSEEALPTWKGGIARLGELKLDQISPRAGEGAERASALFSPLRAPRASQNDPKLTLQDAASVFPGLFRLSRPTVLPSVPGQDGRAGIGGGARSPRWPEAAAAEGAGTAAPLQTRRQAQGASFRSPSSPRPPRPGTTRDPSVSSTHASSRGRLGHAGAPRMEEMRSPRGRSPAEAGGVQCSPREAAGLTVWLQRGQRPPHPPSNVHPARSPGRGLHQLSPQTAITADSGFRADDLELQEAPREGALRARPQRGEGALPRPRPVTSERSALRSQHTQRTGGEPRQLSASRQRVSRGGGGARERDGHPLLLPRAGQCEVQSLVASTSLGSPVRSRRETRRAASGSGRDLPPSPLPWRPLPQRK